MSFWFDIPLCKSLNLSTNNVEHLKTVIETEKTLYMSLRPQLESKLGEQISAVGLDFYSFYEVLLKMGILMSKKEECDCSCTRQDLIEMKRLYFKLAQQYHPDRCDDTRATLLFQHIVNAYERNRLPMLKHIEMQGLEFITSITTSSCDQETQKTENSHSSNTSPSSAYSLPERYHFDTDIVYLSLHPVYNYSIQFILTEKDTEHWHWSYLAKKYFSSRWYQDMVETGYIPTTADLWIIAKLKEPYLSELKQKNDALLKENEKLKAEIADIELKAKSGQAIDPL